MKKISQEYYNKTKIIKFDIKKTDVKTWPLSWKVIHAKTYPRLNSVKMSDNINYISDPLGKILLERESGREFSKKKLDFNKLCELIFYSAGVVPGSSMDWDSSRRFYPSAGARYPLEVYLISNNMNDLKSGLYHYNIKENKFEEMLIKNLEKEMLIISGQEWIKNAQAVIVLTAVGFRTMEKYGDRGLRHIFIEAGHVGQNIYLVSKALGLKTCALGGFIEDKMHKLLDIDPDEEFVVYMLAVGV